MPVTGRLPTEIDPEVGEQRASAESPWPALCDRETIPQSRRAAPARVTGSQPGKIGRLSEASKDLTTREPVHPLTGYTCGAVPSSDLLDQLHLRAVGRGNPAHMAAVVEALFEDLRAVLLEVCDGAGVIVGFDGDVLDADMLLVLLVGDDGRHIELHTVQVELAAAARNFPLHGRAEIVDVELRDLLRILSGLDVDVPELHGHTRLLRLGFAKGRRGGACRSQLGSTSIGTQPAFARYPALSRAGFRPHRCCVTVS